MTVTENPPSAYRTSVLPIDYRDGAPLWWARDYVRSEELIEHRRRDKITETETKVWYHKPAA